MKALVTSLGSKVALCAIIVGLGSTAFAGGSAPRLAHVRAGEHPKAYAPGSNRRSGSVMSGSLFKPSRGDNSENRFNDFFTNPAKN